MFNVVTLTAEAAAYHHEEYRNEEDSQHGRSDHPAHYTCTDGILRTGACTRADDQRHYPKDKRQGRHQDWTQTHTHRFQRGLNEAFTFFIHQVFGEFHDKYRVLRRQANGCQQAHLEVNVVGQTTECSGE
ncbi:hypothetical protein D3C85_1530890 [compost metagenome]